MSGNAIAKVVAGDRSGVVDAGSAVVLGDIGSASLSNALLQAIALRGSFDTVPEHLGDGVGGARVLSGTIVAARRAIVVLHEARVADAVVGGRSPHTAV